MQTLITIYLSWFILLYAIPFIYLSKLTRITQDMLSLNFTQIPKTISKNNFALNIINRMFDDAKEGKRINANAYLALYKQKCDSFVAYVFLSMHIPLIISLYIKRPDIPNNLLIVHISLFVLIFILKKYTDNKAALFTNYLYTIWYDKISNLDLITIQELKPFILNSLHSEESNNLISALNLFSQYNKNRCAALIKSTHDMSQKLTEFINLQKNQKPLTGEDITSSLDEYLKTLQTTNAAFTLVCTQIKEALPNVSSLFDKLKIDDFNAINNNASALLELKQLLTNYKSESLLEELNNLEKISSALENSIGSAFRNVDMILSESAGNLHSGFDEFFDICKKFNNAVTDDFEQGTLKNMLKSYYTASSDAVSEIKSNMQSLNDRITDIENKASKEQKEQTVQKTESVDKLISEFRDWLENNK
ncbi:MAG: hypothetical protein Ta2F_17330 [Termitinemataceae bacterium]|nr:MAG: hypothetical protein Ta2F_17330 [Termitinemataceae bacterium]